MFKEIAKGAIFAAAVYEASRWVSIISVGKQKIEYIDTVEQGSHEDARVAEDHEGNQYIIVPSGARVKGQIGDEGFELNDFKHRPEKSNFGKLELRVRSNPRQIIDIDNFQFVQVNGIKGVEAVYIRGWYRARDFINSLNLKK